MRTSERSLERHLTEKIDAIEVSLKSKIDAVETNLTGRIVGVEKFFTAENKAAKDAVSIAMTATEKAAQKKEISDDERARTQTTSYTAMNDAVMKRLDQITKAIDESGGWKHGVGSSLNIFFQIIASIGVIIGVFYIAMKH
jgi:hypothetical protein